MSETAERTFQEDIVDLLKEEIRTLRSQVQRLSSAQSINPEEIYQQMADEIRFLNKRNALLSKEIKAHETFRDKEPEKNKEEPLRESLRKMENENKRLEEDLGNLEAEKEELEKKCVSSAGRIRELESELELQFKRLSSREDFLESRKQELELLADEQAGQIARLEEDCQGLKNALRATKEEKVRATSQVELEALKKLSAYSRELEIQNGIGRGRTQEELEQEVSDLQQESREQSSRIVFLEAQLQEAREAKDSLEAEAKDLRDQVRHAKRLIQEQANEISNQERNSLFIQEEKKNKETASSSSIQIYIENEEKLKQEVLLLKEKLGQMQGKREEEKLEKSKMSRQIDVLNKEIQAIEKHYEGRIAGLERAVEFGSGETKLEESAKEKESQMLKEEVYRLGQELKKSHEKATELREEVRMFKSKLDELSSELLSREKNDDLEIDKLERQVFQFAEALKIKDRQLKEKEEEIKRLTVLKAQWICKKCETTATKTKREGNGTTVTIGGGTTAIVRHGTPTKTRIFDAKNTKGSLKTTTKQTVRIEDGPEPKREEVAEAKESSPAVSGFLEFYGRFKEAEEPHLQRSLLEELIDDQPTIVDGAANCRARFMEFLTDLLTNLDRWFRFHGVLIAYQNLSKNRITVKNLQNISELIPSSIEMVNPDNLPKLEKYMNNMVPLNLLKALIANGTSLDSYWSAIIENKFIEACIQCCHNTRNEEDKLTGISLICSVCDVNEIQRYFGSKPALLEPIVGLTNSVNLEIKRQALEVLSYLCKLFEVREYLNNERHAKLIVSVLTRMKDPQVVTHTLYALGNYSLTHWGNKILGEDENIKRLISFLQENGGKWKMVILQSVLNVSKSKKGLKTIYEELLSPFQGSNANDQGFGVFCEIFRNVVSEFDSTKTREELLNKCMDWLQKGTNIEKVFTHLLEIMSQIFARFSKEKPDPVPQTCKRAIGFCIDMLSWDIETDFNDNHVMFLSQIFVYLLRINPEEVYTSCTKEFTEDLVAKTMNQNLSHEKQNALLSLMNEFLKEDTLLSYFEFSHVAHIIELVSDELTMENGLKLVMALLKDKDLRDEMVEKGLCEILGNLFLQLEKLPQLQLFIITILDALILLGFKIKILKMLMLIEGGVIFVLLPFLSHPLTLENPLACKTISIWRGFAEFFNVDVWTYRFENFGEGFLRGILFMLKSTNIKALQEVAAQIILETRKSLNAAKMLMDLDRIPVNELQKL